MDYLETGLNSQWLIVSLLWPLIKEQVQWICAGSMEEQVPATELQWTLPFKQDHCLNPETYPVTKVASQSTLLIAISRLSYLPAYAILSKTYVISGSEAVCVSDLLIQPKSSSHVVPATPHCSWFSHPITLLHTLGPLDISLLLKDHACVAI